MSAPVLPRFKVATSVRLSQRSVTPVVTSSVVLDTWLNHTLVREFTGKRSEERAVLLAAHMEELHAATSDAPSKAAEAGRGSRSAPVCGTISGYTNLKCRCSMCRLAWSQYWRRYRAWKHGRG